MQLVFMCALPIGGRCPPGGSMLIIQYLTMWWSSQLDSSNRHSSTLATPGRGHSLTVGRGFPKHGGQMLRWMGLVVGELGSKTWKDSGSKTNLCLPRAVNFGAAGSIMAHELLHIFYQLCG